MLDVATVDDLFLLLFPSGDLVYTAAWILVKRNPVSVDKLGIL